MSSLLLIVSIVVIVWLLIMLVPLALLYAFGEHDQRQSDPHKPA